MFAVPLLYLYPCLLRSFTLLLSHLLSFTWGTLSLSLFFFYILPVIFLLLLYFIFILVYLLFDLWYFCCPFALSLSMFYILSFTWGISFSLSLSLFYLLPGEFRQLQYLQQLQWLRWQWFDLKLTMRTDQKCGWIQFAKKTCRANIAPHFCSNLILVKRYD